MAESMLGAGIGPSLINVAACLRSSSIEGASFPGDAFDKECVPYKLQTRKLFAESHSDYCCKIPITVRRDSAVKLVDDLAGESPVSADYPVGAVVISGDGTGDQTVGSLDVNALEGWT
jgi:hypothetical protein